MAEDLLDKTEPASPKKLADAHKKGMVSKSQDFTISMLLVVNMFIVLFFFPFMYKRISVIATTLFSNLYFPYDDPKIVFYWLREGIVQILIMLSPMLISVFLLAIALNLVQVGFVFSTYPMKPKWKRLNPFLPENYKRYFNFHTILKMSFDQIRFIFATVATIYLIGNDLYYIYTLPLASPVAISLYLFKKATQVGITLALFYAAVSAFDLLYMRWKFYKDMRMSRREVKDETRLIEGDINVKAQIRSRLFNIIHGNIDKYVPLADVVITNSSKVHALALRYHTEKMAAPVCIAKGSRKVAVDILSLADKHLIPIIEDSQLTQLLYGNLEIGKSIPPVFYNDLAFVYAKLRKMK